MSEFVFDLQRFADTKGDSGGGEINPYTELEGNGDAKKNLFCNSLPHLRIFSSIVNNPFVKSVLDNDKDAVEKFSKYVKPVLEFTGGLYGTQGLNLEHGLNIIVETSEVIESLLAIIDTVDNSDGTKTYADFGEEITLLISRIESITDSYLKLKGDETIFMELSAVALAYGANVIATFDGTTPEEQEELAKDAAKLIGTEVASIIKTVCKDASATAPFGWVDIVTSVVIGAIEIVSNYGQHINYYLDDNLPEETAFKEAMLDAVVSGLHDGFSNYVKGLDDWVFDSSRLLMGAGVWLGEAIKSWFNKTNNDYEYTESKKNYAEWWRAAAQKLAYGTTNVSDTIEVDAANSSLYAQDGNDQIYSVYQNVTIYGGHGNDSIRLYEDAKFNSVFGGTGDDYLYSASTNGTIYGGKDADFFFVSGNKNVLLGEEDNDKIVVQGNSNSISGGKGNDLIILDGAKNAVVGYTQGDGVDAIFGYDTNDIIKIKGDYSTVVSGNDIIIQVGTGGIIVKDAKDLKLNINTIELEEGETLPETQGTGITNPYGNSIMLMPGFGDGSKVMRGTNSNDKIKNTLDNIMIYSFDGDDSVHNTGDSVTIDAGAGNDYIENSGSNTSIDGGDGNDDIYNYYGTSVKIESGDGNDSIYNNDLYNYGWDVTINAGAGNDYIENGGDYSSINAGAGNDSVRNDGGYWVTIDAGAGNDSIYNRSDYSSINAGDGDDYIQNGGYWYGGSSVTINAGAGNDSIYNDNDNVTIDAGAGNDSIHNSGDYSAINAGTSNDSISNFDSNVTIDAGAGDDSIHNYYGSDTSIDAGSGNDSIYNQISDVSINAGEVNDIVSLDSYYSNFNVIQYTPGDGNDTIYGFNEDDTLQIGGGTYSTQINGDDIIVTVGKGKITLFGAANKTLNIDGEKMSDIYWRLDGTTATYGTASNTLLTVSGVKSLDGLSVDGKVITVSAASLGTSNVTVSGDGYTLKLSDDVTAPTTEETLSLSGTTATLKQTTSAKYTLSKNVIKYSKKSSTTLATVKGVKSLDGLSVDGKVITVSAASLGTSNVTVSGDGYTLKLGDDVTAPTTEETWSLSDTTATLKQTTSAEYTLSKNVIKYSKKSSKTLAIVKGVKSLDGLSVDGKVITVSAASLGTSNVTVSGDGYTLALGDDVTAPTTKETWSLSGTTATLKQTTSDKYSLASNAKSITHSAKTTTTLATVKGVKSLDGLSVDGKVVTVSAAALNKTKVTISGDGYTLKLGSDVAKPSTKEVWRLSGSTATLKQRTSDKYSLASNAKFITHSAKTTTTLAIVKGVKSLDGLSVDGKVVTVSAAALNKTKISISGDGYTLALGSNVAKPSTKEAWSLSGSTATLKQTTSDKYSLASNAKSITHSAKTTTTLAIVKGVKSLDGLSVDGKVVTVSAAALNKTKVTISGDGYTLALGSNVAKPSTKEAWRLSGSTATLEQTTSDKYSLASNAKSITHSAKTTTTLAIVKGVKSLDGLSVDGKVVTVSAAALNKTKVTISGDGYTLALGSNVAKPSTKEAWRLSGSTATLEQTTSDKYSLASNAKSITHSAKTTTTLATVKGVKSLDGLSANGDVVKLKADTLNKKVTVSGGGCEFDFAAGNYNGAVVNASSNNDVITSCGKNLSVSGGAGNDVIKVFGTATTVTGGSGNDSLTSGLGGNVFVYASGDGNDIIANFAENDKIKVTKGTPEVMSDGYDVIVTVDKGSIKLSGAAGQNISVTNSKGVEKIYKLTDYWFMADTPASAAELSSFVENHSEAYPLAEFETSTPLTQKNILLATSQSNRRQ